MRFVLCFCLIAATLGQYNAPWDAAFSPEGDMFYTEKCLGLSVLTAGGRRVRLLDNSASGLTPDAVCVGQSGWHGVAFDPDFGVATSPNRRDIYVFFGSNRGMGRVYTNRVARVTLGATNTDAPVRRVDIIDDIIFKDRQNPVGGPGAHSGGRIRFGPRSGMWRNTLFVTSGDNHNCTLPQDLWGLGSKIFAVDRNGAPYSGNVIRPPLGDPRIFFYGVRNVQGIAFRPGTDEIFISEHGPNHSDEVTKLVNGGNGGWDPQRRPNLLCQGCYCGYSGNANTMPMTDRTRFPNAVLPVWSLNGRSAGMGPCVFLEGPQWGRFNGWLAVGVMGDNNIALLEFNAAGQFLSAVVPTRITRTRYRSLVLSPSTGNLLAVTDTRGNTGGNIFEITPAELLAAVEAQ